jgi:hypothetical protein
VERRPRRDIRQLHEQVGVAAATTLAADAAVASIDRGVSLNRALWMLAEEMRRLKA